MNDNKAPNEKIIGNSETDFSQVINKLTSSMDNKSIDSTDKKLRIFMDSQNQAQENIGISCLDKLKAVLKTQGIDHEPLEVKEKVIKKILKRK